MRSSFLLNSIILFCYGNFQETFAFHSRNSNGNSMTFERPPPMNQNFPNNQDDIPNGPLQPENFDNIPSSESLSPSSEEGPESTRVPFVVETFADHFISAIAASDGLFKAFQINRLTPEEAGSSLFGIVHSAARDIGAQNPDFIAQMVQEAVKLNHHLASDMSFLNMHGYVMGKFLLLMRALTLENAHDLAQKYFEFIRNGIISEDGTPDGDMRGIADGFKGFVDSLGLANSNTIPILAVHYANEWYNLRS